MKRFTNLVLMLLLVFSTTLVYADDNETVERSWPDEVTLPAWETQAEKQVPPAATDDVTPPPTEPVRAVAEFELQEGVQMAYPFGYDDMFVEMVRACQDVGVVYMVVENTASMSNCSSLLSYNGVPLDNIEYVFHPMNAMWSRDYGPHFVWGETSGEIAMIDWQYYDSRPFDDEIPDYLADQWHMKFYETPMYHEGGNYMSDGHGTAMCSTVLYDDNQGWTQQQCEQELMDYFGVDEVNVYQKITWDATGHIDLWAKMVNDTTILVARMQPDDPNYTLVEQHAARMAEVMTVYGTPFHVERVQMPPAYTFYIWHYYKSFMNSLIFNGKVLVPIFTTETELSTQALAAYQAAMPDYEIVGIYSDAICAAGGAIHCTTIGIADHIEDYYHDASITTTPVAPPIQIPANGGNFEFNAVMTNNEGDSIYTEAWSEVTLPNGSVISPIISRHVPLPAGGDISRGFTQAVPATAPAGTYTYTMYTGERLPRVVNDESSFTFEKLGVVGDISESMTGWYAEEVTGSSETLVSSVIPTNFDVLSAYPNPFNPTTQINYNLPDNGIVELAVYDVTGAKVVDLVSGYRAAGSYQVTLDASGLASGIYFAQLNAAGHSATQKLVLMK